MNTNIRNFKGGCPLPHLPYEFRENEEPAINKIPPKSLEKIFAYLEKEPGFKDLRQVGKAWNTAVVKMAASKERAAVSLFMNILGEHTRNTAVKEQLTALAKNTIIVCSKSMEELKTSKEAMEKQLETILRSLSREEWLNLYTELQTVNLPKPFKNLLINLHIEKELRNVAGTAKEGVVYQKFFQDFLSKGDWENAAHTARIMYRDHRLIRDKQLVIIIEKASEEPCDKKKVCLLYPIAKQISEKKDRANCLKMIVLGVLRNQDLPLEDRKELALFVADMIKNRKIRAKLQDHIQAQYLYELSTPPYSPSKTSSSSMH